MGIFLPNPTTKLKYLSQTSATLKTSRKNNLFSSTLALSILVGCLLLSGCLDAGFRLEQSIKEAVAQAQEGNTAAAINKLESLQDKFPSNADIAEALAIAYEEHGNYLLSSNYYQKSARLSPEKRHLLKLSAEGQIKAGRLQDAASRLQTYLETFPEDGATWLNLGRIQFDLDQKDEAIDSLSRGLLLTDREDQVAKDYYKVGRLYLDLRDFSQADYYLNNALTLSQNETVTGQVLMGLVKSSVEQEDWDVADIFLKRIASSQSELLNTNEVKSLMETVRQIMELRDNGAMEPTVVSTPPTLDADAQESGIVTEIDESVADVINESQEIGADEAATVEGDGDGDREVDSETNTDAVGEGEDNAEVVVVSENEEELEDETAGPTVEIEEASIGIGTEILSDTAVDDTDTESSTETETDTEIVIDAVDTESKSELESDGDEAEVVEGGGNLESEAESSTLEDGSNESVSTDTETDVDVESEVESEPLEPYEAPHNEAELLLIQAQQAIADGEIPSAIRMSWDSINQRPENPAGWFILSRAYVKFNQNLNAESAALEAMRLNPKNKKIALNYLGILQRSRGSDRFHVELLKVYQRFSTDPDFVLALARSYARIKNDPQNSAALYRRFFDLAPEDPRAAEVRQEASFVE